MKSEVASWVLNKPAPDARQSIVDSIDRSLKALPDLLDGQMEKAMAVVHTHKPVRAKPPRPPEAPKPT